MIDEVPGSAGRPARLPDCAGPRWPSSIAEAAALQDELRPLVDTAGPGPRTIATAAGVDVAYRPGSDRVTAGAVVLDAGTLHAVEARTAEGRAGFAYRTGFLAFRELPAILTVLRALTSTPDLLVCDGAGLAHPRRFGLACHLGVLADVPTIGVAKTPNGAYRPPAEPRGSWTDLIDSGDVVGRALRTQDGVRPVFVSVGHRIDLDTACAHVLALSRRHRLPETTRQADRLARAAALR
jgi:deoxyribonuclease V